MKAKEDVNIHEKKLEVVKKVRHDPLVTREWEKNVMKKRLKLKYMEEQAMKSASKWVKKKMF